MGIPWQSLSWHCFLFVNVITTLKYYSLAFYSTSLSLLRFLLGLGSGVCSTISLPRQRVSPPCPIRGVAGISPLQARAGIQSVVFGVVLSQVFTTSYWQTTPLLILRTPGELTARDLFRYLFQLLVLVGDGSNPCESNNCFVVPSPLGLLICPLVPY